MNYDYVMKPRKI